MDSLDRRQWLSDRIAQQEKVANRLNEVETDLKVTQ
jgi:hypothetical protein